MVSGLPSMHLGALRIKSLVLRNDDKQCPDVRAEFCVHFVKTLNGKRITILKQLYKCVTG